MPLLNLLRRLVPVGRVRSLALLLAVLGALALLAHETNGHQPFANWLFWPYAGLWGLTLAWALSCLSIGHLVLRALSPLLLPPRERLVFDFAVGVLAFAVLLFVAGLFAWLRGPFCIVFPLLLAGLGGPSLLCYLARVLRHFRTARRHACIRPSPLRTGALVLGTLGLTIVYLTIMLPDNAAFDAQTYHLAMAEGWAAAGRIGRFPEGWFPGTIPHLASWLYTWPFTFPSLSPYWRVGLAAHMEFFLFVMTLAATPLLVEALCPRRRAGLTWVMYFLFPGLFLYDSSLGVAADHVLAFWAVPLALAARRTLGSWKAGRTGLLGLMVGATAMVKYQALYLLAPLALLVFVDGIRVAIQRGRAALRFLLGGPVVLVMATLVASAPHWLANVVWYGNPVYPMLKTWFPWSHPWVAGWKGPTMDPGWTPEGPFTSRLLETGKAVFTFAFVPHDWPNYHRDVPVFGFLFTLSLLILPFVRGGRRVWLLVGGASLGVFLWYWTYHQDRYLQLLLPWMVACTAATFMLAWSSGRLVRVGLGLLVGLQLVWGGDVPFLPTHAMMADTPIKHAITMLSSTFRGESETRLRRNLGYFDGLASYLPEKAAVLLHEEYLRYGMARPVVADSARWQGGIDYLELRRPDRVFDLLRSYGVTQIVWETSHSLNQEIPLSGELVFYDFVLRHGQWRRNIGRYALVDMPTDRPAAKEPGPVLFLGCRQQRNMALSELDFAANNDSAPAPTQAPDTAERLNALLAKASFAVTREGCTNVVPASLLSDFTAVPRWGGWTPWVRK